MSEIYQDLRSMALRVAMPLATLAMLTSCTGSAEPVHDRSVPTWQATVPEPGTTAPPFDLCAGTNPAIAPFHFDDKLQADTNAIFSQNGENTSELADQEVQTLTDDLATEYGVTLLFLDKPAADVVYDFGAVSEDPKIQHRAKTEALRSITKGLQLFSPELIKALGLKHIAYVKGITKKPEYKDLPYILDAAAGVYDEKENTIYIDFAGVFNDELYGDTSQVVVHEISHAIDSQLLCKDKTDMLVDKAFTKYNTQDYQGYSNKEHKVDQALVMPSAKRQFENEYGLSNADEDRATTIESTFSLRGLVMEGDPDWDSPFRHKQAELVRRLEELTPGISIFLLDQTKKLRADTSIVHDSELDQYIENEHQPGQFKSAETIVKDLVASNTPLEIATDAIVMIDQTYDPNVKRIIKNPIFLRSPDGVINQVVWSDGDNHDLATRFLDSQTMHVYISQPKLDTQKGPLTIGSKKVYFQKDSWDAATTSVNGIFAEEGYANNQADIKQFLAKYPTKLDPDHS